MSEEEEKVNSEEVEEVAVEEVFASEEPLTARSEAEVVAEPVAEEVASESTLRGASDEAIQSSSESLEAREESLEAREESLEEVVAVEKEQPTPLTPSPLPPAPKKKTPRPKFKFKKWMSIPIAILVAFIVVSVVLGLVTHPGMDLEPLHNWEVVRIYSANDSTNPMISIRNDNNQSEELNEIRDIFVRGIQRTRHSYLRALLELNYVNDLRFALEELTFNDPVYDENGYRELDEMGELVFETRTEMHRVVAAPEDVFNRTRTVPGTFLLDFEFGVQGDEPQSIEIRDNSLEGGGARKTVYFDRVMILVHDSRNEIAQFEMFFFTQDGFLFYLPDEDPVETNPILIRMNTSRLYQSLLDIREIRLGDRDNGEFVPPEVPDETPPDPDDEFIA